MGKCYKHCFEMNKRKKKYTRICKGNVEFLRFIHTFYFMILCIYARFITLFINFYLIKIFSFKIPFYCLFFEKIRYVEISNKSLVDYNLVF